ncbi:hypothetical protein M5K25_006424 [Dendrobium thyrsiflorum]|uniref:Uncharacterized protein n=1 Tax=Dendrobium thyrsiflorum TaxID=117978 RepID=A0ABD0VII8_DENTH
MVLSTSVARQQSFQPSSPDNQLKLSYTKSLTSTVLQTSVACRLWSCRPNGHVNTESSNFHHVMHFI